MSVDQHFLSNPRAYLRELAAQYFDPADEVDRDRAGRDLIEASVARREASHLAAEYEPSYIEAARALADDDPARFGDVIRERRTLNELRASIDTSGLQPTRVTPDGPTGLSHGLGLIRTYAANVVPDKNLLGITLDQAPADVMQLDAQVDPTLPLAEGSSALEVEDVSTEWHRAVMPVSLSRQVLDFGGETAGSHIDRLLEDATDRAAEQWIGEQLLTAAGTPATSAATLPERLDELEGMVAGRGTGHVWFAVHPVDLPTVRRAVAASWTDQLPHPTLLASIGTTEGTVLGFGADSVTLEATEHEIHQADRIARQATELAVARPFRLAVTDPLSVRAAAIEAWA